MDQATQLRRIIKEESGKIHHLKRPKGGGSSPGSMDTRVIAVTSGKGGVGKTNVVGNLAIACQKEGRKTLIFDADLGLANIDIIFGLNPQNNISDVIRGERELSQIIVKGPEEVGIIPAASGIQELSHLSEGHKINLLNEFDELGQSYDMLFIDTGAGISSNVIYFNLAAQERIIVVTPEPTSMTDAYALIKVMFNQHGTERFSLLMNMVRDEREALSVFKHLSKVVSRFMGSILLDYAGYIPWDNRLQEAVTRREPVVCSYPEAPSSQGFRVLAKTILNRPDHLRMDGNIKFFWKKLMSGAMESNHESKD